MPVDTKPVEDKPPVTEKDVVEGGAPTFWKQILLLALGIGVLIALVYFSPLHQYLGHRERVSQDVRSFGALAPLVITLGVAALVAVGFPRLLFCVIAGMALGFWSGLLWAQLGTLIGNYALFVLARAGGRDWMQRFVSKRTPFRATVQQRGALAVVLARQLPLPGLLINLTCALLPIRHVDFIVGTVVGQLPQAIPCTLIGAGALQASSGKSMALIGIAVIAFILAGLGVRYVLRRALAGSQKVS